MRLSTRLSLFFIVSLSVVLAGFSIALYLLASKYLYRQLDERLEAALNTLAAAAEITPAGVEWEPHERRLSFGRRILEGRLAWQVCDAAGQRLDGMTSGGADRILASAIAAPFSTTRPRTVRDDDGVVWRATHRRIDPPLVPGEPAQRSTGVAALHSSLLVAVAISTQDVATTLRNLGMVLAGLSLGVGLAALVCANRISRRALRPVSAMAEAARAVEAIELHQRLPVFRTGDELEELGMSFNALLDRLQESLERQRRFTGDASHQLRTPLTAIQGQVDLALRQDRDPEEYRRVLSLVQRRTGHLRQIVESLLFLARADHEHPALEFETVDLREWLADHARTWHDTRRSQDLRLEFADGGSHRIRAQPALLSELVDNLLDNASRYSEAGTPIRMTLNQDQSRVLVGIEDEGIGIAEQDIPHIFEPFYRSAQTRLRGSPGSGLGLAIARRLASIFGGTVAASRRRTRGSRFTISFPVAPTTDQPLESPELEGPDQNRPPANGPG
jgi:signal transduction histidine kinase